MRVTRIQAFESQSPDELTEDVNDWLKQNERNVVVTNIMHSNSQSHLTVVIVYTAPEEFFDDIDPN